MLASCWILALCPAFAVTGAAAVQASDGAARTAALQAVFDGFAEQGFSGAVLVGRGEETLLAAAAGLADRIHGRVNRVDTIFDIGSLTKQFTAAAVLELQERKKLSVDDGLERFFDGVPKDKRAIHLHHLMTHTSGLPTDVHVGEWTKEVEELLDECWKAKLQAKPGEKHAYNNVGYMLLAAVIEKASGVPFETFVTRELFAPAGMTSSGFLRTPGVDVARTARGYDGTVFYGPAQDGWYSWGLRGAGGVLSTVGDLQRWSRALDTDAVLTRRSRELLFEAHVPGYGYGWRLRADLRYGAVVEHGGTTDGFECFLARYVDRDLCVIVLCNDRGMRTAVLQGLVESALAGEGQAAAVELSGEVLAELAGEYECAGGGNLKVSVTGGGLRLKPDLEAVLVLEFGAENTKLQASATLAERARRIVAVLSAGDEAGAKKLLSDKYPNWEKTMFRSWQRWIDELGELEKAEVLGSRGDRNTVLRLVHERGAVFWTLDWSDGVLSSWSLDGGLPQNAVFRPTSEREFAFRDLRDEAWKLAFDSEDSGKVRGLSLSGKKILVARRVR